MTVEEVKIISKTDKEIVFASKADLRKFWDEITNGKVVLLTVNDGNVEKSELLNPINAPDINDGRIILKSEQKMGRVV
jgi:hypothetical protein